MGAYESRWTREVIDPRTRTLSYFGDVRAEFPDHFENWGLGWCGAVLAQDGKMYCMPLGSPDVLVVDPVTQSLSTFNAAKDLRLEGRHSLSVFPGVLAADGLIYCVASFFQRRPDGFAVISTILVIDPIKRT